MRLLRLAHYHSGNLSSSHIGLANVPRTALPSDLLRLCGKAKVENVEHGALQLTTNLNRD